MKRILVLLVLLVLLVYLKFEFVVIDDNDYLKIFMKGSENYSCCSII